MVGRLFPEQRDLVLDPARFKSARCPRRAGKTYACTVALYRTALSVPSANCLYLTLTRGQAWKNIWIPLRTFNQDFELGGRFHGTNLQCTLPGNARITLSGAETVQEIDKLRGQAYDLVIIDECKSFSPPVLQELINEVIRPALMDRLGSLILIGTPGNILAGPFFEATTPGLKGVRSYADRTRYKGRYRWSFHTWGLRENVALPHAWASALSDKEENAWSDDDPRWIREYLGEWCPSDDIMVYAFDPARNTYEPGDGPHGLPDGHHWNYLLGLDLGFEDPVAIVVMAYSETCNKLYQVWDFKAPHLTVAEVAAAVHKAQQRFGKFEVMVMDRGTSGGKTMQASLSEMYGLHFVPAEKHDKPDYIDLMNSDLTSGKVLIRPDSHLAAEMKYLQWQDSRRRKEDPQLDNHACDAALYVWRYAYHHYSKPAPVEISRESQEYFAQLENEQIERIVSNRLARRELGLPGAYSPDIDRIDPWMNLIN